MNRPLIKARLAETLCGAIIVLGMGFGGVILAVELLHALTRSPYLEWVPGIYPMMLVCVIVGAYIYWLVRLMGWLSAWAEK